jgi:hypothetical protein
VLHNLSCLRYFRDPAAPDGLRAVEEPGRCARYWELWTCAGQAEAAVLHAKNTLQHTSLFEASAAAARERLRTHLDVCPECRAWVDSCEQICLQACAPTLLEPVMFAVHEGIKT